MTSLLSSELNDSQRWGYSVVACLVALVTPFLAQLCHALFNQSYLRSIGRWILGFGSGFLLMSLFTQLFIDDVVAKDHSWEVSLCLLFGFTISLLIMNTHVNEEKPALDLEYLSGGSGDEAVYEPSIFRDGHWVRGMCLNEFIRNFCNGLLIVASFFGCSHHLGWVMTVAIVISELPLKMLNHWNLVYRHQHAWMAMVFNVLSTLPVFLGWLIVNLVAQTSPEHLEPEFVLALGAGTVLYTLTNVFTGVLGRMSLRNKVIQVALFCLGGMIPTIVIANKTGC